ncbi:MAG: hypothetical protein ACREJS_09455 [Candidatus Rokuibacteriota bacterium]
MKLGLAARDVRLLALLVILSLSAALLVLTSWPDERDMSTTTRTDTSAPLSTPSPAGDRLPAAARRVAAGWAEAYFTSSWRDSPARRSARLKPYSSNHLIAEMATNSGALELSRAGKRWHSEAEVVALQQQDGTPGHVLVAIVERTTSEARASSTELVTVTLELTQNQGRWRVASVLVP